MTSIKQKVGSYLVSPFYFPSSKDFIVPILLRAVTWSHSVLKNRVVLSFFMIVLRVYRLYIGRNAIRLSLVESSKSLFLISACP